MNTTAQKGNTYAREALADLGMSIAELSRASGVRYGTVFACVAGYQPPSLRVRELTAQALEMDPDLLWGPESDD